MGSPTRASSHGGRSKIPRSSPPSAPSQIISDVLHNGIRLLTLSGTCSHSLGSHIRLLNEPFNSLIQKEGGGNSKPSQALCEDWWVRDLTANSFCCTSSVQHLSKTLHILTHWCSQPPMSLALSMPVDRWGNWGTGNPFSGSQWFSGRLGA